MSLARWLMDLAECGRVRVPPPETLEFDPADLAAARVVLLQMDADARIDAPLDAPPLVFPCARWATVLLYRACQFLAYRDLKEDLVRAVLREPCPKPPSAAVFYSVDLIFRHLPELVSMSRGISEDDPLAEELMELCRAWPLSSVGVKGLGEVDASGIQSDPSLRRIYADRVIERQDVSRLGDFRVAEAVREAVGLYPSLAPGMPSATPPFAESI